MKQPFFQSFSFIWAAASLVGAGVGCAFGWLLHGLVSIMLEAPGDSSLLSLMLVLPVMGLGMGVAQAWALRGAVPRVGWWAVGAFFGWLFGLSADMLFRRALALPPWATFVMIGLYLGALQWLVIFRRLPYAALWVVINPLVWVLLYVFLALLGGLVGAASQGALLSILAWAGVGGLYGLLSGPLMQWLLRSRAPMRETP